MQTKLVRIHCPIEGCRLDTSSVVDIRTKTFVTPTEIKHVEPERVLSIELFDHDYPSGAEILLNSKCEGSGRSITIGILPVCGTYLGDNDGTCPQLTCLRAAGHAGDCDNVGSHKG